MYRAGTRTVAGFWTAVALTIATMLLWGFAHRLFATLMPGLGAGLGLSPEQSDMTRSAIALGYFLTTLPGAFVTRNFGCKTGMLLGLGVFACGIFLLYPALERESLIFFIAAAAVFGSGLAIVGVSVTPLVVRMGTRSGAIQRQILADTLSPLGALAALFVGRQILAGATLDDPFAHNLVHLLSAVGVAAIVLAFVMEMVTFPPIAESRIAHSDRTWPSFLVPLRIPRFRSALAATFLTLFAQIIVAGFAARYALAVMPSLTPAAAQLVLVAGYGALLAGRIIGPILMIRIDPMRLLVVFAVMAALCTLVCVVSRGPLAVASLIGTAFFMSIVIPTITADAIRDLGETAKSAAALIQFVAFSGTGLFALLATANTAHVLPLVMLLPAVSLAAVAVLSVRLLRSEPAA